MTKQGVYFWIIMASAFVAALALRLARINVEPKVTYDSKVSKPFCGITSVATICALRGINTTMSEVYRCAGVNNDGTSSLGCKRALKALGVTSDAVRFKSVADLPEGVPILCALRSMRGLHAVVIIRRSNEVLFIDGQIVNRFPEKHVDALTEHVALVPY